MDSIDTAFADAVCQEARQRGIPLAAQAVQESFTVHNAARNSAVKCFRIAVSDPSDVEALSPLRRFRLNVRPSRVDGGLRAVECVLAGAVIGATRLDWSGRTCDAIG